VKDAQVSSSQFRPLAPDNTFRNLSASAALDLPWHSRLSGTVALGLLDQNKELLPYSFHSNAIA
jgi:hypothetical protein